MGLSQTSLPEMMTRVVVVVVGDFDASPSFVAEYFVTQPTYLVCKSCLCKVVDLCLMNFVGSHSWALCLE